MRAVTVSRAPRHVAVVVPARDEETRIGATLAAIAAAARRLPRGATNDVVVVADCCTDATASVARAALPGALVLQVEAGSAGGARRLGTIAALARAPVHPGETWIASTDADTLVPRDWLATQVGLAASGVGAVAGVVELRPDESEPALRRRFAASYGRARSGAHPHVHGANLGFRADAYLEVGGWRPLATGEDVDLWHRLRAAGHGLPLAELRVRTSARTAGRAPAGFAADLARLVAGRAAGEPLPAVGA